MVSASRLGPYLHLPSIVRGDVLVLGTVGNNMSSLTEEEKATLRSFGRFVTRKITSMRADMAKLRESIKKKKDDGDAVGAEAERRKLRSHRLQLSTWEMARIIAQNEIELGADNDDEYYDN